MTSDTGQEHIVELDHLVIAVEDLEDAARQLQDLAGLEVVGGGSHPSWGTQNLLLPVGSAYLELVAVVDEEVASRSGFGSWVMRTRSPTLLPSGWAVRPESIDDVAARLGLTVQSGSRRTAKGELLTWRLAGVGTASRTGSLPFFIAWDDAPPFPVGLQTWDWRVCRIVVGADSEQFDRWLPTRPAIVEVVGGQRGILEVELHGPAGVLSLGP